MNYYKYDRDTGAYDGLRAAQEHPFKKGVYLAHGVHETSEEPPTSANGETPFFENGAWVVKVNNIGKVAFDKITKQSLLIDYVGELKNNHTLIEPKSSEVWGTESWVFDKAKLLIDARLTANIKRDVSSTEPISVTLESEEEVSFKVSGLAKDDISEVSNYPELFPMTWRCEEGNYEITHNDIKAVKLAVIQRRSSLVATYGALKDTGFDAMTAEQLSTWINTNKATGA